MLIHVSASLGTPIYLQIQSQLKHAIAAGALKHGDILPSVRKLASDLRVNPNTVAHAYQNLERDGVIRTVPGGGTYVANNLPGLLKAEKVRRLQPFATHLVVEGMHLRLAPDEILKLVQDSLDELGAKT